MSKIFEDLEIDKKEIYSLIAFYKNIQREYAFVLTPSIASLIQMTVKILEKLLCEGNR